MSETVSFPGLGLDFEISRVAFTLPEFLGSFPVYWYGITVALGLLAGLVYFFKRTPEFGLNADRAIDAVFGGIVLAIICARLYYVIFSFDTHKGDLLKIFNIREGGIAIYGAIIGGFAGAAIMCKIRRVKFLPLADLASGSLLLGQAIGRWGNFVNTEAFGSNTTAPWGMTSPSIVSYLSEHSESLYRIGVEVNPQSPVHPAFLYESLWCLAGFLFIAFFTNKRRFDGQLTLIYLGWYGLGRFFIEGLRTDSLMLGAIRVSRILAILCFIASIFVLFATLSKIKREGDDSYLIPHARTEDGRLAVSGEYYEQFKKKKDEAATTQEEKTDETEKTDKNEASEEESDGDNDNKGEDN